MSGCPDINLSAKSYHILSYIIHMIIHYHILSYLIIDYAILLYIIMYYHMGCCRNLCVRVRLWLLIYRAIYHVYIYIYIYLYIGIGAHIPRGIPSTTHPHARPLPSAKSRPRKPYHAKSMPTLSKKRVSPLPGLCAPNLYTIKFALPNCPQSPEKHVHQNCILHV